MTVVDDYIQKVTPDQRAVYERLSAMVQRLAPGAVECISYGIPTFKYRNQPLIYFGAFTDHTSLFPASDGMIRAIPALEPFRVSKGTLRFNQPDMITDAMIQQIAQYRLADIVKK